MTATRRTLRRGFTLLEVALAVAAIVTLAALTAVALRGASGAVNEAGTNYTDDYLGELDNLLSGSSVGGTGVQ